MNSERALDYVAYAVAVAAIIGLVLALVMG